MDNFFNISDSDFELVRAKMTANEFIDNTKKMLKSIMLEYQQSFYNRTMKAEEYAIAPCDDCNGEGCIKKDNEEIRCSFGRGDGCVERCFDMESFLQFMESEIMFGSYPFFDLIDCEIVEDTQDVALRKPDVIKSVCDCEKPNIALHPMYLTRYCTKCGKDEQTVL
jgi:hypothetical protein